MRTIKNILYHTFIGLKVKILKSSDYPIQGMEGVIIDETKNLLVIETNDGKERKIQKVSSVFRFFLEDGNHADIDGKKIAFRPVERPKKVAT